MFIVGGHYGYETCELYCVVIVLFGIEEDGVVIECGVVLYRLFESVWRCFAEFLVYFVVREFMFEIVCEELGVGPVLECVYMVGV